MMLVVLYSDICLCVCLCRSRTHAHARGLPQNHVLVYQNRKDGTLIITKIVESGPAARLSSIMVGDILVAINDTFVRKLGVCLCLCLCLRLRLRPKSKERAECAWLRTFLTQIRL